MKDNSKTKMDNIVQLGCLISKLMRLFVNFLSAIVIIFYRECKLFMDCYLYENMTFIYVDSLYDREDKSNRSKYVFPHCEAMQFSLR
jgi:hypothetical protein